MLLNVLDRPGDGCEALKRLLLDNHDPRPRQRQHIRRAIAMYRSLVRAGVIERLDEPDEDGRRVRVTVDLQIDFALHQRSEEHTSELQSREKLVFRHLLEKKL